MKTKRVVVVPYDEAWKSAFEEIRIEIEAEIGDLLFSVVNLARRYKVDPAVALSRTNEKFCRRFKYVEKKMALSDLSMDSNHLQEMDIFWNEAKDIEP